jgi:transposase InsO family protein
MGHRLTVDLTERVSTMGLMHRQLLGQGLCEMFLWTLKCELVYRRHFATRDEVTRDIFEYSEVFYDRKRRHSALGHDSSTGFETRRAGLNLVSTKLGEVHTAYSLTRLSRHSSTA